MKLAIVGLAAIVGMLALSPVKHHVTKDTVVGAVITNKERIQNSDSSVYLVWSTDETFKVADSLWAWNWRSSDQYGKIPNGATCDLEVTGWRMGWPVTMYRNILSADCTTPTASN